MKKTLLLAGMIMPFLLFSQSNPSPQSLPFTLTFGTSGFTAMPSDSASWSGLDGDIINSEPLAESSVPTADASISSRTTETPDGGTYGLHNNANARLYVQTSSNNTNGVNQLIVAVNSGAYTSINVSYDLEMVNEGDGRSMGIILQYRKNTSGSWTSVASSSRLYNKTSAHESDPDDEGDIDSYSYTIASLTANTDYQFRWAVWRAGSSGASVGMAFDNIIIIGDGTCDEPSEQPQALFISPYIVSVELGFSVATGSPLPTGYIVLRSTNSSPSCVPVDGTSYTVGSTLGDCTVISLGLNMNMVDRGLSPSTSYYYRIYGYIDGGNNTCPNYYLTNPLSGNTTTYDLPNVAINELDVDDESTDDAEFIELKGTSNLDLEGLALVFFNGNDDQSYKAIDLDAYSLNNQGFFVYCTNISNVTNCDAEDAVSTAMLQNGADAVALFAGDAVEFTNGTQVTSSNLLEALVYDTDDADDTGLLNGLNQTGTGQINENQFNNSPTVSMQKIGTWGIGNPTPGEENALLPIELTVFYGRPSAHSVELFWETASESNNDYFLIENSLDGMFFHEIGKQPGSGNSYEKNNYSFMHSTPSPGENYYRLKQVDLDGQFSLSKTINIVVGEKSNLRLFPSPVQNELNLVFEKEISEPTPVWIFNKNGQMLFQQILQPNQESFTFRIGQFPAGIYFMKIQLELEVKTFKIVKM